MPNMDTLQDDFSTGTVPNGTRWPTRGPSSDVFVSGGVLSINTQTAYYVCQSAASYTITNSYLLAQVVAPTTGSQETYMSVDLDSSNLVAILVAGGALQRMVRTAGTDSYATLAATYNPTTHAWWRIRHDGTGFRFGYSADGATWTETTTVTPSWSVTTSMRATLMAGRWNSGDPVGTATYDNVNLPTSVDITATPDGLAITIAHANPTAAFTATTTPSGIAVPLALDGPSAESSTLAEPDGINDSIALDEPTALKDDTQATPDGIADTITLDEPAALNDNPTALPDGIADDLALGDTTADMATAANPTGDIALDIALDPVAISFAATTTPTGIALTLAHADPTAAVHITVEPASIQTLLFLTPPSIALPPLAVSPVYDPIVPVDHSAPQLPTHLMGIGPWNDNIVWNGAPNYGAPGDVYPISRPVIALPDAVSRTFTLRLNAGSEARADFNLPRSQAFVIEERSTDLWWRRRDPRRNVVDPVGRFNADTTDISLAEDGRVRVSATFTDYRALLEDRLVLIVKDTVNNLTQWDKGTPVAEILQWLIPTNMNLDLTEVTDTATSYLGTITTPVEVPPGTTLGEAFKSIQAVSTRAWEWWVDMPDDDTARPVLRFAPTGRGVDKGVWLIDTGTGQSPIKHWAIQAAGERYANAIFYQGGTGGVVETLPADVTRYGQHDAQDADTSLGGDITRIKAAAAKRLAELASRQLTWTLQLRDGFWEGRAHIDIGDWVNVRITLGGDLISGTHRVAEIQVEIDDTGNESVTLTLGPPRPARDPRSRQSSNAKFIRAIKNYTRSSNILS